LSPETISHSGRTFTSEIDQILIAGIHAGRDGQLKALERVQRVLPSVGIEAINARMQEIAAGGIPPWVKAEAFWTAEMDRILLQGISQGQTGERIAITKILRLHPELRTQIVWRRLTRLRQLSNRPSGTRTAFTWTATWDALLLEVKQSGELESAIAEIQQLTGFPREAVMRRARKLGVHRKRATPRPWTDADLRFLVETVQHLSVKVIAKELHRTERAVWRKTSDLGLSAKCEEGYTVVEVMNKLHVWHRRLKDWIGNGWIKIGRNRRITERSLRSFFREHPEELKWERFDGETVEWLLEFGVTRPLVKEEAANAAS
jgi:hypothetical protein